MTTIKSIRTNINSQALQSSPTQLSKLNKKTDIKVRKKLEPQSSPINKKKRDFETVFPSSSDASSENQRIAKIAFPISPTKLEQKPPSIFAIPKQVERVSAAGQSAAVRQNRSLSTSSLPKPDFSKSWTSHLVQESKSAQPTPIKKSKTITAFEKLYRELSTNNFKYKVTFLGKGSYSNAYTLENNVDPIIPGVNNSDLVLKAFHGEKSGFGELKLRHFLKNKIENYYAVKKAGLPVAEIYNAETALQDGYIIQRKVSGKVDPLNIDHLLQVSPYFDVSVKEDLIMDIQLQNFAFENGQAILFDFLEDIDKEEIDELDMFNKKIIEESWLAYYKSIGIAKDKIADLLNRLTANHYQKFIQELLSK